MSTVAEAQLNRLCGVHGGVTLLVQAQPLKMVVMFHFHRDVD
jgi:hypothetical protein